MNTMGNVVLASRDRALRQLVSVECDELGCFCRVIEPEQIFHTQEKATLYLLDGDGLPETPWETLPPETVLLTRVPEEYANWQGELWCCPFSVERLRERILWGKALLPPDSFRLTEKAEPSDRISLPESGGTFVRLGEQEIALTSTELALLTLLYSRRGETVSREELVGCLSHGSGARISNRVEVHICSLRHKLEKNGERFIETVRGIGYRFV